MPLIVKHTRSGTGELNHITHNVDMVIAGKFSNPALRNFFGLGNNTKIDPSKRFTFYQTRFQSIEFEALIRRRFFEKLQLMAGPWFYNYQNHYKNNSDNILSKQGNSGFDSARTPILNWVARATGPCRPATGRTE